MKKLLFLSFAVLLIISCDSKHKKPPIAKNGVLDLRGWDFEKDGNVYMYGEWEFYWKKLLKPEDFKKDSLKPDFYITFPSLWDTCKINGKELGANGFATYRLKILLGEKNKNLGFFFWNGWPSARVFVDGKLILRMGEPNTSFKKTSFSIFEYPNATFFTDKSEIELIIQVSNFEVSYPGVPEGFRFQISNDNNYTTITYTSTAMHHASIGILLIIGLYHILIFFYRKENRLALYFGLLCFSIAIEDFFLSGFALLHFQFIDSFKYQYLIFSIIILIGMVFVFKNVLFAYFFKKYFSEMFSNWFFRSIVVLCLLNFIFLLINPWKNCFENMMASNFIFLLNFIYCLYVTTNALFKKKEGSFGLFLGFILFLIFYLNTFFQILGFTFITELYTTQVGLVCLTVSMAIVLAKNFSKAFKTVEIQAEELTKHKEHLEELVEERTFELKTEKDKSEKLLLNVLPEPIADRLKQGETPIADHFEEASVIFIDIADFTKLSARSKPQDMVKMLNDVFSIFDKISAKYGLEKIKTIGDCYMAAAGIPVPRVDHAEAVARMAVEVMETMKDYRVETHPVPSGHPSQEGNTRIQFRIGLDCGPIVAGVIGEQKFIYDLWGDMVNTASRMEAHGIVGRIQCTERFANKLTMENGEWKMKFEERGEIEIKGKGMMKTYFIN